MLKNFIQQFAKSFGFSESEIYAGFFVRAVAAIIDIIFTTPLIWVMLYSIGFDFSHIPTLDQMISGATAERTSENKIADFISWVVSISYSLYFITSPKQATPGKRIMNIYVATKDGKKLSTNLAFARFLASLLSGLLLGFGFLLVFFTKEKTALHDLICNTRVFYGKKN
jgi:uncharacterized RDD family membrane protein YckC